MQAALQAEGSTAPTRKDCGLLPRRGLDSGVPPGSRVTLGRDSGLSLPVCTPGLTTPTAPAVRICRPGGQLGCCPALTDGALWALRLPGVGQLPSRWAVSTPRLSPLRPWEPLWAGGISPGGISPSGISPGGISLPGVQ